MTGKIELNLPSYKDALLNAVDFALNQSSIKNQIQIKTYFYDNKPLSPIKSYEKMLNDHCSAIIGYEYLSDLLLIAKIQHDTKIPIFTSYASSNKNDKLPQNIFMFMPTYDFHAKKMLAYLHEKFGLINNILMLTEIDRSDLAKYKIAYSNLFAEKKIYYDSFDFIGNDNQFEQKLLRFIKKKHYNYVFVFSGAVGSTKIINLMNDHKIKFIGTENFGSSTNQSMYVRLHNIKVKAFIIRNIDFLQNDNRLKRFKKAYVEKYAMLPSPLSAYTYDAMMILLISLKKNKLLTVSNLLKNNYTGITGAYIKDNKFYRSKFYIILSVSKKGFIYGVIVRSGVWQNELGGVSWWKFRENKIKRSYAMKNNKLEVVSKPAEKESDLLTELLRTGAKALISRAVELELESMLSSYADLKMTDGRQVIVRNGYLPERTVQTGIGSVEVKVPKVRDRSDSGIKFNSTLLPPYLKRSKSIEELIPWLYLKGISTGDCQDALVGLVGEQAKGLSANTVSRLKSDWIKQHQEWCQRDLSQKRYAYFWVDGIYSHVRMDDRLCLLVIVGVTEHGDKELVAVEDGFRESSASWEEVLTKLRQRGLDKGPKLAVGDGALGFWAALGKIYPDCQHQRCWVHKTANVLNKVPKTMQPKVKQGLHQIWMAATQKDAEKAFDNMLECYEAKYPKAMECLRKDRSALLAFYNFPAEHWVHIRTTNPIESAFATVRLRSKRSKNCGSRETTLTMVFKLLECAEKRWRKFKGFGKLELVINNVPFKDGEMILSPGDRIAA